jgi:hypothetical protein
MHHEDALIKVADSQRAKSLFKSLTLQTAVQYAQIFLLVKGH